MLDGSNYFILINYIIWLLHIPTFHLLEMQIRMDLQEVGYGYMDWR